MRITQASISSDGSFFKEGIIERWGFQEYYDEYEPCFFFGLALQIDKINNHKGIKIIYLISPYDCLFTDRIENGENVFLINSPFLKNTKKFKVKNIEIELKRYDEFKPTILGNKIYCYIGWGERWNEFNQNLLSDIQKNIDYEIIYGIRNSVEDYLGIEELKTNFYEKCFLSLNLSIGTGMTTVRELGFMGIKTIMNTGYNFPSIIKYRDLNDIVEIIQDESKKIGTIQNSIDCHNIGDEWLNTEFWTEPVYYSYFAIEMRNEINTQGLYDLIDELPPKIKMMEVGCYVGESTKIFLNSGKIDVLYAVDLWEDIENIYENIKENHKFETVEKIFDNNTQNLNVIKLKGDLITNFNKIPDLDCVYIDANHNYDYVYNDIMLSLKKLKRGGIICGHDYNDDTPGVIKAVNEFFGNPDKVFSDSSWMVKLK